MRHTIERSLCAALVAMSSASVVHARQESPATPSEQYRIEPSDVLLVRYRYSPEYDHAGAVRPDGFLSLPLVGDVAVGGLTVAEAVDAISQQARRRLRDPEITVEVKEFQRPRFFVTGEVGQPGEFPLRGRLGVLQAIAMAGGFKSSAKHSQVLHVRRLGDRHAVRTLINAKDLPKNPEQLDMELQAGDLLFVPQNRLSKVISIVPLATPLATVGLLLNPFVD